VHALVSALGLFRVNQTQGEDDGYHRNLKVTPPTPGTEKDLLVYHDREYVAWLLNKDQNAETSSTSANHATMQHFGLEEVKMTRCFSVAYAFSYLWCAMALRTVHRSLAWIDMCPS
jgi:hypothetical protein